MNNHNLLKPFPVMSLPQTLRNSILEVQRNTQAPLELVASSQLAAASLACQWHVVVRGIDGRTVPCGQIFIIVADSGERKSGVDRHSLLPFTEYDAEQLEKYDAAQKVYTAEWKIWDAEYRALIRKLEKLTAKDTDTHNVKLAINALLQKEPQKPRRQKILYSDVSPQALAFGMYENSASVGIVSAEAGNIMSSSLFNNLSLINTLRDGDPITVDRRTSESFTVNNGRITISLMLQSSAFKDFLAHKGDEARGSGFFARALFTPVVSTQGTRYRGLTPLSWEHLPIFQGRITELLKRQALGELAGIEQGETVVHLSPSAHAHMVDVYNTIEYNINPGGWLCNAKDYASKVMENIFRLAATLHFFSGEDGVEISSTTFEAAEEVVHWYAQKFVDIFTPPDSVSEAMQDVQLLEKWFKKMNFERRIVCFPRSFIRKYGPNILRNKDRLDLVLGQLASQNKVWFFMTGKTHHVEINLSYFNALVLGSPLPVIHPYH